MEHNLYLSIRLVDGDVVATLGEPESGFVKTLRVPLSVDEHPLFNEMIGDEIYSWVSLWADEEDS